MAAPSRAKLRAILLAAAGSVAGSLGDRSQFEGGDSFDIELQISGLVNGKHKVDEICSGKLTVNHDSESKASKACDQTHLVALLLEAIPPAKRKQVLAQLPKHFATEAELPTVRESKAEDQAKQLLAELRHCSTVTRSGSLRFSPSMTTAGA